MVSDFDSERNGTLNPHSFNLLTNKIGVFFTTQEIRNIKDVYAKGNCSFYSGELICYRDLFEDVKYSIPEQITALIAQAFNKLDPNNEELVCFKHVISCYNPLKHPHVLSRRKSP